jgi:hypothetical protein
MKCFASILLVLSFLCPVSACAAADNRPGDLTTALHKAFSDIYSTHYCPDFPPYKRNVDRCYAYKDKACLKAFNEVMDAKQFLMAQVKADPDRVLKITLDTIFEYADKTPDRDKRKTPDEGLTEATICNGAIIALYFFNQDKQDRIILDRVKTAPPKILELFFPMHYEWQYNRPDPEPWVKFVETLPEKEYSALYKKQLIETLRKTDYEKFGLMLDRPTQKSK